MANILTSYIDELRRSYDRNLGYARFCLGVAVAILSLLFTFGYDRILGGDGSNSSSTEATAAAAGPASGPEIAPLAALAALLVLAGACFFLGFYFRVLYRRDNAMLAALAYEMEQSKRQEGAL